MIHSITPEIIYFKPEELEKYKENKIKEGIPPITESGKVHSAISIGFVEEFARKYYESLGYSVIKVGDYVLHARMKFGHPDKIYRKQFDLQTKQFIGICFKYHSKKRIQNRVEREKEMEKFGYKLEIKNLIIDYPYNSYKNNLIIERMGKKTFELICDCNASFLGSHPDLFVYNDKEYFFVEVKSKKDKLYCNQLVFISFVKYIFEICDCKILKVLPEGSKILTKFYEWDFEELFKLEQFNTFPYWRYSNNGTY